MFATFDKRRFPLIHIKLSGTIHSDAEFDSIVQEWKLCNDTRKPYTIIFDSTDAGIIDIKYAVKIAHFIQTLKTQSDAVYLEKSIIICKGTYIRSMLSVIFKLQKPNSPVYIVNSKEKANELYIQIQNGLGFYDPDVSFIQTE